MAAPNWTDLLNEAVTKPGLLLKAYSHFHSYSIGNQMLAISQCAQREIEPGALNTYPGLAATWPAGEEGRAGVDALYADQL